MNGKQRIVWIVLASCLAAVAMRGIERHGRHGMSVSTERDGLIDDCRQMRVTFDDAEAARAEQTLSGPAPRGALRFRAPANSGIFVLGADRSDVSVTACKAAAAEQDLSRIAVSFEGGDLVVRGPESRDWLAHLIVQAPRATGLDLEVTNGPVAVRGMTGVVTAHTQNGPLSFEESSGPIRAEARNGPISLKACPGTVSATAINGPVSVSGSGGDVTIKTQNGPISVRLAGNRWDGRLEAHARNGPFPLPMPREGLRGSPQELGRGFPPDRVRRLLGAGRPPHDGQWTCLDPFGPAGRGRGHAPLRTFSRDCTLDAGGLPVFWLAQKAGKKAASVIENAIRNDPETEVKTKAASR